MVGEKHAPRAHRAATLAAYFLRLPRLLDAGRLVALDPLLLFALRLRAIDLTFHTGPVLPNPSGRNTKNARTQNLPVQGTGVSQARDCNGDVCIHVS